MKVNLKNEDNLTDSKEFKLLFNLLEKAEQILSIINLSDSSISKYNTLKQLTFEMLNLEFKPLEKKYITAPNQNNLNNIDNNNQNNINDSLYLLYFQYMKKSMLIDLLINFMNNSNNLDICLVSLNEIYKLSDNILNNKSINDIFSEIKSEEEKLPLLFSTIEQSLKNNHENKIKYENGLLEIKENYNKEINDLQKKDGKNKKLIKKKDMLIKINKSNQIKNKENDFYLEKINAIIDESYEKYKLNFPIINNSKSLAYKDGKIDENILKLEFVKNAFDEYFNKNKYSKNNNDNIYVNNNIRQNPYDGNNLIRDIYLNLPEIQKDNEDFHKKFNDLMNYISTNIEGKLI